MGIMAGVLVYVAWERRKFCCPKVELSKVLFIIFSFLILGLLPYIDNFAHFGGLLAGLLLGVTFAPYYSIKLHKPDIDRIKVILIFICAPLFSILCGILLIIFYEVQPNLYIYYLTCPFGGTLCQDQRPTPDHRDIDLVV